MARLHIHISVDNLQDSTRFYTTLFNAEPSVSKQDYAKWELDDPAVNFAISRRGAMAGLDHLGLQADSDAELRAIQARLEQAGIAGLAQRGTACCYAESDKYWTKDPDGVAWEAFHTLDSIPTFNRDDSQQSASGCCVPEIHTDFS